MRYWHTWDDPVAWARAALVDPATVFLDTETTGIAPGSEVVDLAVIDGAGRVLLDTLVRPRRPIPPVATGIHGLTDADVAGAPSWCEVYASLCPLLLGRRVIIYNARYDHGIIEGCCHADGLMSPGSRWECAMLAYAQFRAERAGRSGGYRWHKLTDACHAHGIPPGGHRALADAVACRAVVTTMAEAM